MLGVPRHGWVDFRLGNAEYELSYLGDIPQEWLDRSIFGMESGLAFQVEGHCEPGMLQCVVERRRCCLVYSSDGKKRSQETYTVEMDMLQFCRELHEDISRNLEAWSRWQSVRWDLPEKEKEKIYTARKQEIAAKLQHLEKRLKYNETACCK